MTDSQDTNKQQQEPVAWRDHVEQRLLTWRQSFVNKSGDQLALDDFMDKQSLDDLIDFVCDEYTSPQPAQPSKPLTRDELRHMYQNSTAWQFYCDVDERLFGRPDHGIKGDA